MRIFVFLIAGLLFPIAGYALDAENARQAVAHELAQCAGFYLAIAELSTGSTATAEDPKMLQKTAVRALEMARKYASNESELGQIGGGAAEWFIFGSNKPDWKKAKETYTERCTSIMASPESRYTYWLSATDGKLQPLN